MADNDSFEVEIVDDGYTPVEDDNLSSFSDDNGDNAQTAEQKAEAQAKAEQEADPGSEKLTAKQRKDKAKERINELTRKYRDEERKRVELERERDQERTQFQTERQTWQQAQVENAKVVYHTLSSNKRLLEANLAMARDRGDTKTENQIQDQLTDAREKMGRLKQHYPGVDQEAAPAAPQQQQPGWQQPSPAQQQQPAQSQPGQQGQLPDAARAWVESNSFLRARPELHATVEGVRQILVGKGLDSTKPEFYDEMTKRLKTELPEDVANQLKPATQGEDDWDSLLGDDDDDNDDQLDAGQQARQEQAPPQRPAQQQTVGDGGRAVPRTPGGKRKIKLTREQVQQADRMGISREAYAAQVARQPNANGYTEIGD